MNTRHWQPHYIEFDFILNSQCKEGASDINIH